MTLLNIRDTYGPIFGMDQMCDGTIPDGLSIGDTVILETEDSGDIYLTVAAVQALRGDDGEVRDVVGIGLRGQGAELVKAGDVLSIDTGSDDIEECLENE